MTGPQRRRAKHKSRSRKAHAHEAGTPCAICRPGNVGIRAWVDEAVPFRPYNKSWMQSFSGGKRAGRSSAQSQMPGTPVQ